MNVYGDLSLETTLQLDDGHTGAVRVAFNDAYNATWPVMLVITARIRSAGGQAKELPSLPGLGVDVPDHLNFRLPPGDDGSRNWQPPPGDDSSRYRLYAVKLIEKYDQDQDQLLTQEEWAATRWSRCMQLAEVDTDGDGKISAEELAKAAAQR